jgi:branched-chain amino acid transport system substrate-binding protein
MLRLAGAGAGVIASGRLNRASADIVPIRIGFTGPFSGKQQLSGLPGKIGAEGARDWINARGGVLGRPIEFVERDDQGDANMAVGAMRELTSTGVNLVMGALLTGTSLAVQPIIPSLNAVYISTGSPDDRLTHELFNRNCFTTTSSNQMRLKAYAGVLGSQYPDVTVWGAAFPDIAAGHEPYQAFSTYMKRYYSDTLHKDVSFAEPQTPKFGATDFKTQISALMAQPIQGIYTNLFGADGITFMQQAKQLGLFEKVKVVADQGLEFNVGKVLGKSMPPVDWTVSFGYWQGRPDNEEGVALSQYFVDKTGDHYPAGLATFGYAAVKAYAAAIEAAKSTETKAVIDALEKVKFQTVRGPSYFRPEDHRIMDDIDICKLGPKDTEPFWEVKTFVKVPGASVVGPPAPGKPVVL